MAASLPVLFLAFRPTIARAAAAAFLAQRQAKLGGADGALGEDHARLFGLLLVLRLAPQPGLFEQLVCRHASVEPLCVSMRPMEPMEP